MLKKCSDKIKTLILITEKIEQKQDSEKNMKKTNAIRELETHKIEHIVREYEVDEDHLDALSVAIKTNEDITRIFKTLVLLNEKKEMIVACIPGLEKLDLKKLAKISGSKKVEMLPMKDLFSMTGYLRGGCSPIAIKKDILPLFTIQLLTMKLF